ncbi:MAG: serine/threonine protein kinase [Deltaproteobacteria bacterium]|nr:serine/threonine protein kinase [Deltaproteobacteria bacterium]
MTTANYSPIGIGVGTLIAGRYEVTRKLGAGTMSVVFSVVDKKLKNEEVALKLMAPVSEDAAGVDRFRNELILTRKLTHPNIIRTYEFGETEKGQLFITMEKVKGFSLETLLINRETHRLEIKEVVFYLHEICQAVAYAHEHGIIHRDLKPGNILISFKGDVKIADFGLARSLVVQDRYTQVGETVGTPAYMAPEQIQDKNPDHHIDLYAIGIIGFELLTGKRPFEGQNWFDLAKHIIEQPLPDVMKQRRGAPAWLAQMITKATNKDPTQRFSSAKEMLDIITPNLKQLPAGYGLTLSHTQNTKAITIPFAGEVNVSSFAYSPKLLRVLPYMLIFAIIAIVSIAFVQVSKLNDKEIADTKQKIEHKVDLVGRFIGFTERFLKIVDHFEKKEEDYNKFLQDQEKQKGLNTENTEQVTTPTK